MRAAARPTVAAVVAAWALSSDLEAAAHDHQDQPPPRLRDTGLYASWKDRTVHPDNLPFLPQYPLWSDGARKRRWVHIPAGRWVDASQPDGWQFPVGTRFWKELAFGPRLVETRYLERLADGSWRFATYRWDREGREAELAPEAGAPAAHEIRPGLGHRVPGVTDCRACHEGKPVPVLGFDALQLSQDRDPLALHADGDRSGMENDLGALVRRGLVRGLPEGFLARPSRTAGATARGRAALGYLHANCGGCHNQTGPLAALDLPLSHPAPRAAGIRHIVPGRPGESPLLQRMRSRHPVLRMPPLGTELVDEQAVALLERWIAVDLAPRDLSRSPSQPTSTKEDRP